MAIDDRYIKSPGELGTLPTPQRELPSQTIPTGLVEKNGRMTNVDLATGNLVSLGDDFGAGFFQSLSKKMEEQVALGATTEEAARRVIEEESVKRKGEYGRTIGSELEKSVEEEKRGLASAVSTQTGARAIESLGFSSAELGVIGIIEDASKRRIKDLERSAEQALTKFNFQEADRAKAEILEERKMTRERETTLFSRLVSLKNVKMEEERNKLEEKRVELQERTIRMEEEKAAKAEGRTARGEERETTKEEEARAERQRIKTKGEEAEKIANIVGANLDSVPKDNIDANAFYDKLAATYNVDRDALETAFGSATGKTIELSKGATLLTPEGKLLYQSPDEEELQFVSGTENQSAGYFNKSTGIFTPLSPGAGGKSGSGGAGEALSDVEKTAQDMFSGASLLKISDLSTAKNFRNKVSQRLTEMRQDALKVGDMAGIIRASAGGKETDAEFNKSLEKAVNVVYQLSDLQKNIEKVKTGPIMGIIRSANPYDTKAQLIKAQLTAIVPNLARGIYGEVGVLTDQDVKLYSQTIPNLKNTEDVRKAILAITVRSVQRSIENKIKIQAGLGRDVSGISDIYNDVKGTADRLLSEIGGQEQVDQSGQTEGQKYTSNEDAETAKNKFGITY